MPGDMPRIIHLIPKIFRGIVPAPEGVSDGVSFSTV